MSMAFPLPADVIYNLLLNLPTFAHLQPLLLASKSVLGIFNSFKLTITHSIGYNEVGSALPQALRLVRCKKRSAWKCILEHDMLKPPISPSEARRLTRVAAGAHLFEDLFSQRCKNRSSLTSTLKANESHRFHRALYRLWLYAWQCNPSIYAEREDEMDVEYDEDEENEEHDEDDESDEHDENDESDENEEDDEFHADVAPAPRDPFFEHFTTAELRELKRVADFVAETAVWIGRAIHEHIYHDDGVYSNAAAYLGPGRIISGYHARSIRVLDEYIQHHASTPSTFNSSLERDLADRGLQNIGGTFQWDVKGVLLDEVTGEGDTCDSCNAVCGVRLYNHKNWAYLQGIPRTSPTCVKHLMPGHLSSNHSYMSDLRSHLLAKGPAAYEAMLDWMFEDTRNTPTAQLTRENWLCHDCIVNIMRDGLWRWWRDERALAGALAVTDCWYGYNCRTQTHKSVHARKLNHLAVPTRGD